MTSGGIFFLLPARKRRPARERSGPAEPDTPAMMPWHKPLGIFKQRERTARSGYENQNVYEAEEAVSFDSFVWKTSTSFQQIPARVIHSNQIGLLRTCRTVLIIVLVVIDPHRQARAGGSRRASCRPRLLGGAVLLPLRRRLRNKGRLISCTRMVWDSIM